MSLMAVRRILPACALVVALVPAPAFAASPQRQPDRQKPATLSFTSETRLLVVAPHPDDEVLGAGGMMQRVRAAGGEVRIVYLTDGDGYPEGVEYEDHVATPTPADYRGYGATRKREARNAVSALKLGDPELTFLSFPDGGLCNLMTKYWSERRHAFRSPYTRLDRPPLSDVLVPDTRYRGEDLTQELAQVIGTYRPTLIVVPRREDQHADHCAASYFVGDAIIDVTRVHSDYRVDLLNYIVHFEAWPFEDARPDLMPPPGLPGGASGWIRMPLRPHEVAAKRAALRRYQTQMHVMAWFLNGFARTNEVFSRPAPPHVLLPLHRSPCCDQ